MDILDRLFETDFISEPPRYRTHEELGRALAELAGAYPGLARLSSIGRSPEGREVYCLELGNPRASRSILLVANAHGEELRGTEELLHMVRALLGDEYLRTAFLQTYRFTVIPTVNPDAREWNLRWAHERIDLAEFFLSARRSIPDEAGVEADMEWGYPTCLWDRRKVRRPEASALRHLIAREKFSLYINLHGTINSCRIGFWYLVGDAPRNREAAIEFLHRSGIRSGLPLIDRPKLEGNQCFRLRPGVFTLCTHASTMERFKAHPELVRRFKRQYGASSADYLSLHNPGSQCFVGELPTLYHERYLDATPLVRLRSELEREDIGQKLLRLQTVTLPLFDEAIAISPHPILKNYRRDLAELFIPALKADLSLIDAEHGDERATLGELLMLGHLSEIWCAPAYGRFGLGGYILRLPGEEQDKLAGLFGRCREKARACAAQVEALGLREFPFADSVNVQSRTCLGLVATYFA